MGKERGTSVYVYSLYSERILCVLCLGSQQRKASSGHVSAVNQVGHQMAAPFRFHIICLSKGRTHTLNTHLYQCLMVKFLFYLQIRLREQPSLTEQRRHLPDLSLRERSTESVADALLLLGQPEVCAPGLPAAMADSIGHEFLRTLQVPLHHAHQNQALQRGENYLSDYPSVYLRIYLSVCLYCLPTNLFLFLSLFFAFGIVWLRLHRLAALQWRSLDISSIERRRLCCTVLFHCAAALCVIWSLCVLIERAADDVKRGLIGLYILPCNPSPQCIMPTASCCA